MTSPMPRARAAQRRASDGAATAAAILAAATKEFAAFGFGGGRVDRIADRAGVSKRMIYHHYANKCGLYVAVLEGAYHQARVAEQALGLEALEPPAAMRRLVESVFDSFVKDRTFIRLMNEENLHKAIHLKRSWHIAEMHVPLLAAIQTILVRGAACGAFRAGLDPLQIWISIVGISYFYFSNIYTLSTILRRDFDAVEARAARRRHVADVILAYLRP